MDKRDRAAVFRQRLGQAMADQGLSKSALARATGVDRSTLSQLLASGETRLPNAQLVADCAGVLQVSTDWLLALTERRERPGDLLAAAVGVSAAERTSADDQLLAWHREARGYKIRHVPATLPDMLKTERVLEWEYAAFLGKTPDQAIRARADGLTLLRGSASDYEIALPRHELEAFAAGEGYYRGLPADIRREQIAALGRECAEYFPALRIFLFDARKLFSAPVTVFGPILATIYVGQVYLAFRSEERVRSLTRHFDWLVRECDVDAREIPAYLAELGAAIA
ncbi:MAG: helix-turn-helix transcriptional regulator [Pseudomonadota bacterium]